MTIKNITMPKLGESVTEGTISSWLVEPGEKIEKYAPLAEVLTDKVTAEIPSSFSGTIKELTSEEGETLKVGEVICTIEVEEEAENRAAKNNEPLPKEEAKKEETSTNSKQSPANGRFSPAVLRIASENRIDLTKIQGSGKGGRITRKDVLQFKDNQRTKKVDIEKEETFSTNQQVSQFEKEYLKTDNGDREIPVNGIRKAIAKHMVESKQTIPHAWMMVEADATNLVSYRNAIKDKFKQEEGFNITYFAFFVKAIAQSLKEFPSLNSTWKEDKIVEHKHINISIAIAANDLLYVPVIKNADEKSIKGIAREIHVLALKARENKLTPEDMSGGTFTANSTGSFGSVQSMGIINHPQAAILQVESIIKRPVVIDNMIAVRDIVNLCLSIDHRILDGLMAGRFLEKVKGIIEQMTKENISIY